MRRVAIVLLGAACLLSAFPTAASAAPVDPDWTDTPSDPDLYSSSAADVAVAPDGSRTFVVGIAQTGSETRTGDIVTISLDPATGSELWSTRYDSGYDRFDIAYSVAVSPDSATVYVSGTSIGRHRIAESVLLAYDAATGALEWQHRCCGTGTAGGFEVIAVGDRVVQAKQVDDHLRVSSYEAATGGLQWTTGYRRGAAAWGQDLVVDGGGVYVVGGLQREFRGFVDELFLAFDLDTGARRWIRTYDGDNFFPDGTGYSGALSPDGTTLYTAGLVDGRRNNDPTTTTIAYDTATGARLWTSRIHEVQGSYQANWPVVRAAADGSGVIVAGSHELYDNTTELLLAEYDPTDGAERWLRRDAMGDGYGFVTDLELSPNGDMAYIGGRGSPVVGGHAGWFAVAYETTGPSQVWVRSVPLLNPDAYATVERLAVAPDGSRVFLTGERDQTLTTEAVAGS